MLPLFPRDPSGYRSCMMGFELVILWKQGRAQWGIRRNREDHQSLEAEDPRNTLGFFNA